MLTYLSSITLILFAVSLSAQDLPNFDSAIDVPNLSTEAIYENLRSPDEFHLVVLIDALQREFSTTDSILSETFYQKSIDHPLINLGILRTTTDSFITWTKGPGHTYLDSVTVFVI